MAHSKSRCFLRIYSSLIDLDYINKAFFDALPKKGALAQIFAPCSDKDLFSFLSIDTDLFMDVITKSFLGYPVSSESLKASTPDGMTVEIFPSAFCTEFFIASDAMGDNDFVVIDPSEIDWPEEPNRTLKDVPQDVVAEMVNAALELGDGWFYKEGFPSWFYLIAKNPNDIVRLSEQLTNILCMPMREMIKEMYHMTQRQFSGTLFIPLRTVEDWCADKAECKPYLRLLIAEHFGVF